MENEEEPGTLVFRIDYDKRKSAGMASGGSLCHVFRLPWKEVGRLFGLGETNPTVENLDELDAAIEWEDHSLHRDLAVGVRVMDQGREVKHGNKTYIYYTIR